MRFNDRALHCGNSRGHYSALRSGVDHPLFASSAGILLVMVAFQLNGEVPGSSEEKEEALLIATEDSSHLCIHICGADVKRCRQRT